MRPGPGGRRSDELSRTFVSLADTLVHDFDVVGFLQSLSVRCVDLFSLASAGVMLQSANDTLQVVASSDERGSTLELMELQNHEGPCLDAVRLRETVRATIEDASLRWPAFTRHAKAAGYTYFAAVPMRLRDQTIGALNLFGDAGAAMAEEDLADAQALADIATIGLLNERSLREAKLVAEQLQHALTSRVAIEQAKGMLCVALDCDIDEAYMRIRGYARDHNERISDVARDVVAGALLATAFAAR